MRFVNFDGRMGTTSRQFLPIFFGFEIHIISMIPHSDPLWGLFLPIKEEYTMRILLIEPNKIPWPRNIADTLEAMQHIVDGFIQAVYPFEEPVALVCKEELICSDSGC